VVAHRGDDGDHVTGLLVGELRADLDHGRLRAVVALRGVVRVLRLVVRVLGAVVGLGVVDLVGVLGAVGRILFGGVVLLGGVVRGALLLGDGGAVPLNRFVGGGLLAATARAQREHGGGRQDGASGEDRPRHDVLLVSSSPQRNRRSGTWRWGEVPMQDSPCRTPHAGLPMQEYPSSCPLERSRSAPTSGASERLRRRTSDGQAGVSCSTLRRPKRPTSSMVARMSCCVRSQWCQTWS